MYRLLYGLSNSYNPENRDEFVSLLEKLLPYFPKKYDIAKRSQIQQFGQISAGTGLGILPREMIWQILLFMNDEELGRLRGIDEINDVLRIYTFWRERIETKYPAVKKYGYPRFLIYHPKYPQHLNNQLKKATWLQKYSDFSTALKGFLNLRVEEYGSDTIDHVRVRGKYYPIKLSVHDKSFIYEMLNGWAGEFRLLLLYFSLLDYEAEKDKDIVYKFLLKSPGIIFSHVGITLREDKDFVMRAVKLDPLLLREVEEKLRNDKDVVMAVMKQNGVFFRYVSKRLRDDYAIVMTAIKTKTPFKLEIPLETGRTRFVLYNISILQYVNKLKDNYDICLEAVKRDGSELQFASDRLKININICLEAIKSKHISILYVGKSLLKEETFRKRIRKELAKDPTKMVNPILTKYINEGISAIKDHLEWGF